MVRSRRSLPQPDPAERRAVDWWVRAVPAVVTVHALGLVLLYARPGHLALWLWYLGPIFLAVVTVVLLVGSLRSARRWRHGVNRWHLMGYLALILVVVTLPVYDPYPSSYDERPSRVPFDEPVTVAWGGAAAGVNYHVFLPDQRWAYDLLVTRDGTSFRSEGANLDDYYGYGLPVLSPASGVVFAAHDDEPDVPIGGWRWGLAGLGNHVGLEVASGEYLFVGHLQPGSVQVAVGDRVTVGQQLGRVGNSGNSSEPHVHLHLQDTRRRYFSEGIPLYFHRYRQAGRVIERGMPQGGQTRGRYVGDVIVHVPEKTVSKRDLPPLNRSRSSVRILGGRRRQDADEAVQHGTDCQQAAAGRSGAEPRAAGPPGL